MVTIFNFNTRNGNLTSFPIFRTQKSYDSFNQWFVGSIIVGAAVGAFMAIAVYAGALSAVDAALSTARGPPRTADGRGDSLRDRPPNSGPK